jgi:hypothetical protein
MGRGGREGKSRKERAERTSAALKKTVGEDEERGQGERGEEEVESTPRKGFERREKKRKEGIAMVTKSDDDAGVEGRSELFSLTGSRRARMSQLGESKKGKDPDCQYRFNEKGTLVDAPL